LEIIPQAEEWSESFAVVPGASILKESCRGGASTANSWNSSRRSPARKTRQELVSGNHPPRRASH
jgi:hypothetical protein